MKYSIEMFWVQITGESSIDSIYYHSQTGFSFNIKEKEAK